MSDMTSRPPDFEISPAANSGAANGAVAREIVDGGAERRAEDRRAAEHRAAHARTVTPVQASRAGLAQAVRNVRLVLLVWFVFLALAWVAALPAWRWFNGVLSLAPEGDRLLSGLNIALLRELSHYDRSPTMAIALGSSFTFFLFALILNPFIAGGTLGVLTSDAAGPRDVGITRRFVAEGTRNYWPFARILLLVAMVGGGVTLVLMTGLEAIGLAFDESGWPRASMWTENLMLLMWLMVFGMSSLILDIARIFTLRRDDRRAAAAVKQALGFLWRNAAAIVVTGCIFVVLLAVAIAIYNLIASGITPLSWGLLAFTIAWQQLFALARTTLRIGLLAALTDLVEARDPRPVDLPTANITDADEPVYELPMLG
jgi:hypothetical protein